MCGSPTIVKRLPYIYIDRFPITTLFTPQTNCAPLLTLIQKYAPQAAVDQVTLMLGVSGAIYNSTIEALKDKLGVIQPRLNTLLKKLHHMAVASLNRIWDQRWAMNNHLQLEDAKRAPRLDTGHHQNTLRSTIKNKRSLRRGNNANKSSRLPPKRGQG
jgi:hypothetical protein